MLVETRGGTEITIGCEEVAHAAERIAPYAHRTPVVTSSTLDARCGGAVFLKCENFQKMGAFKFRGAINAVAQLSRERQAAGVVTHSSGNHAQALALAGRIFGVPVTVVMPKSASPVKRAATVGYGARVVSCEPTFASREQTVAALIAEHNLTLVHPFNDWNVIAGQGTAAWELLEDTGRLDVILAPVGGGGLLAGTALAATGRSPHPEVVGVEPAVADDASRSLAAGTIEHLDRDPPTIADGLRTTAVGDRPFAVIRRHVARIVTVSESEIVDALKFAWERLKIVVEPSAAVPIAALLNGRLDVAGRRVGVIISGGNVDVSPLLPALSS